MKNAIAKEKEWINKMMEENEKFFNNVIRSSKNGGNYFCPNTCNLFTIINKKMVPETQEGYDWIMGITSTEWCKSNVKPYVNPQMN
jgi:hypothetical protein